MKKLYGVITAMTTPFTEEGEVDAEALEEQTEFLIEKGVNCLYPTGTTGEMYLLSKEERELIAETVVKKADGRVTVYIHVGAMTMKETIDLARHAHKIGADGIGVVTPSYFTVNERAMVQYYKDVCHALPDDFPVYVYVIPQLARNDISPETMEQICKECKNVIGVKYSYPDMSVLLKYLRVNNGDFSVVFGADHMFLPALAAGADGTVSGCSGPFPELFTEIYRLFQENNMAKAKEAQDRANNMVWTMRGGADMSIFKTILTFRGIRGGHMRKPLLDISEDEKAKLYEKIKNYL